MHNAFWFDFHINGFLFQGLNINNVFGLVLLCLALTGLAITFEALKVFQTGIKSVLLSPRVSTNASSSHDDTTLLGDFSGNIGRRKAYYFMEVSLYVIQVILGYLLMLSVMTYNGYVSLAILLGFAVGYALFGQLLIEGRLKSIQFKIPCQQCLQGERKASADMTVLDEEGSSSCSRTPAENLPEILD
uniref:Copper transport protein n=1 Tax=Graphocephala atropunctata TaxID=36148 RepID=A0A1B6L8B2_9HEMI